jgi:putative hemolysin
LAEEPGRFLSTVQIGITLVGVLAGAFSGAALGGQLTEILLGLGVLPGVASPVGFGSVVALVTYLSIVVGDSSRSVWRCATPRGWLAGWRR